jgi:hypothetical protein
MKCTHFFSLSCHLGLEVGVRGGRVKSCVIAPKVLRSRSPLKVFKARRVFRYLLRNSLWYVAGPIYWNDALARYRTVCMIPELDLLTNRFHSAVHGTQSHHRRAPQHLHSFRDVWDVVFSRRLYIQRLWITLYAAGETFQRRQGGKSSLADFRELKDKVEYVNSSEWQGQRSWGD